MTYPTSPVKLIQGQTLASQMELCCLPTGIIEDLSLWSCIVFDRVMHDEVSDTENIRKNLAIERMIVEGCDILLDTSQTFIRQGKSLFSGLTS